MSVIRERLYAHPAYLYMYLLVVLLLMNHQCMVTNHLKFGLIVLGKNILNYCNHHRHNIVKYIIKI